MKLFLPRLISIPTSQITTIRPTCLYLSIYLYYKDPWKLKPFSPRLISISTSQTTTIRRMCKTKSLIGKPGRLKTPSTPVESRWRAPLRRFLFHRWVIYPPLRTRLLIGPPALIPAISPRLFRDCSVEFLLDPSPPTAVLFPFLPLLPAACT